MKRVIALSPKVITKLEALVEPVVLLLIRLQVGLFFFRSGSIKLESYLENRWEDTLTLFRDIHPVPYLPAELAAPMAMLSETGFSVLLMLGLLSRTAAFGLLGVCGVIYITHQANLDNLGEFLEAPWLVLLLLTVLVRGGGTLSVDTLVKCLFCNREKGDEDADINATHCSV